MKTELAHQKRWSSELELSAPAFEYIEAFYNLRRLHSSLGYMTPAEVESEYALASAA